METLTRQNVLREIPMFRSHNEAGEEIYKPRKETYGATGRHEMCEVWKKGGWKT